LSNRCTRVPRGDTGWLPPESAGSNTRLRPLLSSTVFWKRWTRVIVWDDLRLVYLRVPKSANSSIRLSLPGGEQQRLDIQRLERRFPGHLSFSFVRNPWARLVSVYCDKIRPEPVADDPHFPNGVHRGFVQRGLPMRAGMPFEEFAEVTCAHADEATEKHLMSQAFFLVRDGAIVPSFLGRVESMADDWRSLAAMAGFEAPVMHLNRTQHADYTSYYDGRLVNLVGDRYRPDVEIFGYDFKPDPAAPRA